jgi:hypothetical protein
LLAGSGRDITTSSCYSLCDDWCIPLEVPGMHVRNRCTKKTLALAKTFSFFVGKGIQDDAIIFEMFDIEYGTILYGI